MSKVVIVTGGATGIGYQTIISFMKKGYNVAFTIHNKLPNLEELDTISSHFNVTYFYEKIDVCDQQQVKGFINKVLDKFNRVDILVNNAGITRDQLLLRMSIDEFDQVIKTNLYGCFNMTQGCIYIMMKQKFGRIINITSVIGEMGNAGQSNYAASKAAIVGFSKSIAREYARYGITVNCVSPGFICTNMTDVLDQNQVDEIIKRVPIQRLGEVDDVVSVIEFLADARQSYITGQQIHVNGGMDM